MSERNDLTLISGNEFYKNDLLGLVHKAISFINQIILT